MVMGFATWLSASRLRTVTEPIAGPSNLSSAAIFPAIAAGTTQADPISVNINGSAAGQIIGRALGDAGDVDGDGKGDFLFTVFGDATTGKVVLVFGSALEALRGQSVSWQTLVDNGQAVVFTGIDTRSTAPTSLSNPRRHRRRRQGRYRLQCASRRSKRSYRRRLGLHHLRRFDHRGSRHRATG